MRLTMTIRTIAACLLLLLLPFPVAAFASHLPPGGTFIDDGGNIHEGYIEAIAAEGITKGCNPPQNDRYCPGHVVTREAMAAFLVRSLGLTDADHPGFVDVVPGSTFELDIRKLAKAGITKGCNPPANDRYCPKDPVHRAPMASLLGRALRLTPHVPPTPIAPLTGEPFVNQLLLVRRAMAVKIDNHVRARPQSGLQEADALYEILVEGGMTRFIALYHQSDSSYVGPIRSARPTDPTLLQRLGPSTMAISGAQRWILDDVSSYGVPYIREVGPPPMFRISSRKAPHNLYGDTPALRKLADARGYPDEAPPPLHPWGGYQGTEKAVTVTLDWSKWTTVVWKWDGARYLRWQDGSAHYWMTEGGTKGRVSADTLVVILADPYTACPPPGSSGSCVPALHTTGSGKVLVFAEGKVIEGTWARSATEDPFVLQTTTGDPLTVPPGFSWTSVFPNDRSVGWG